MPDLTVKPLTDTQRGKYLEALREKPTLGNREALRRAGYTGMTPTLTVSRAAVKALFAADPDLEYDAQIARGKDPVVAEDVIFQIARNPDHVKQFDAAKFIAQHRLPDYTQHSEVEVTHTGEVSNPDVAAAIDRFTSLTAAAIRAATRGAAELPPGGAD